MSYVCNAKYGGSLGFFNQTGTTNSALYDPTPRHRQHLRQPGRSAAGPRESSGRRCSTYVIGVQYTAYSKFNGASHNYDGFGRNASDNNSLFFYVWAAY